MQSRTLVAPRSISREMHLLTPKVSLQQVLEPLKSLLQPGETLTPQVPII